MYRLFSYSSEKNQKENIIQSQNASYHHEIIDQYLTVNSVIQFNEKKYKMLRCFTKGQYIRGNNLNLKQFKNCVLALSEALQEYRNQSQSKKQEDQDKQLTIIVFFLENLNNQVNLVVLHKSEIMQIPIKKLINKKSTIFLLNQDQNQKYFFNSLNDFFSMKFFLLDCLLKQNCENIEQKDQKMIFTTSSFQNHEQNSLTSKMVDEVQKINYLHDTSILHSSEKKQNQLNPSTQMNEEQSPKSFIQNQESFQKESSSIKPVRLLFNEQDHQNINQKQNIFDKKDFQYSEYQENFLENLQMIEQSEQHESNQQNDINSVNLLQKQLIEYKIQHLKKVIPTQNKQLKSILHLKSNHLKKQSQIFCLVQDHFKKALAIQKHQYNPNQHCFLKTKQFSLSPDDEYFTQLEANYNQNNKVLLYSKQSTQKRSIVAQYDFQALQLSAYHKIPSINNFVDPLKQVKYQFQSSYHTFYTLRKRQISLFDTRIASSQQNQIFSYKNFFNQYHYSSINFDCFDVHRNGYGIAAGLNGHFIKIFDLRKCGVVNKSIIQTATQFQNNFYDNSSKYQLSKTKSIHKSYYKTERKRKFIKEQQSSGYHLLRAFNNFEIRNQNLVFDLSNKKKISNMKNKKQPQFKKIQILYNKNQNNSDAKSIFAYLNTGDVYFLDCIQGENGKKSIFHQCLQSNNRSLMRKISLKNSYIVNVDQKGNNLLNFDGNQLYEIKIHKEHCEYQKNQKLTQYFSKKVPKFYGYFNQEQIICEANGQFQILRL